MGTQRDFVRAIMALDGRAEDTLFHFIRRMRRTGILPAAAGLREPGIPVTASHAAATLITFSASDASAAEAVRFHADWCKLIPFLPQDEATPAFVESPATDKAFTALYRGKDFGECMSALIQWSPLLMFWCSRFAPDQQWQTAHTLRLAGIDVEQKRLGMVPMGATIRVWHAEGGGDTGRPVARVDDYHRNFWPPPEAISGPNRVNPDQDRVIINRIGIRTLAAAAKSILTPTRSEMDIDLRQMMALTL